MQALFAHPFNRRVAGPVFLVVAMPLAMKLLTTATLKNKGQIDWNECFKVVVGGVIAIALYSGFLTAYNLLMAKKASAASISDLGLVAALVILAYQATRDANAFDAFYIFKQHFAMMSHAADFNDEGILTAWKIFGTFSGMQLLLWTVLPGKVYYGPLSTAGDRPDYKDNSMAAYLIIIALYFIGSLGLKLYPVGILVTRFEDLTDVFNLFALVFCMLLVVKGKFAPSGRDNEEYDNIVLAFYAGIELNPRILGFDVKEFSNIRFGMTLWPLLIAVYPAQQYMENDHKLTYAMISSVICSQVYLFKFFLWVTGYLSSLDIALDHASFYLVWGCMVYLPVLYTNSTLYLLRCGEDISAPMFVLNTVVGVGMVITNYLCDLQRQEVRETQGNCTLRIGPNWGEKPKLMKLKFVAKDGQVQVSNYLINGWWGISRHIHYVPEVLSAFFWSVPLATRHITPHLYAIFLCILLWDRAMRDELRLSKKYGKDYDEYCKKVPWKVIPGIY